FVSVEGLKDFPQEAPYGSSDALVVFGEIFTRGYVNGVVDLARQRGMAVFESTVGRRDAGRPLRPLNAEELATKQSANVINVPLESSFDVTPSSQGQSPVDQLKGLKLGEWEEAKLDWNQVEES